MSKNWDRVCKLKVDVASDAIPSGVGGGTLGFGTQGGTGTGVETLDLSNMRIKFTIYRHTIQTPNDSWLRVYNLTADTCKRLLDAARSRKRLTLEAGYKDASGPIYKGDMIYAVTGRENQTDTFIDINCKDGGEFMASATAEKTFDPGSKQEDHMKYIMEQAKKFGLEEGKTQNLLTDKYPKSFTMFGMARDAWRTLGLSNDNLTYIDMGKLYTVPLSYSNGEIQLDETHGMIGLPQATTIGVIVTVLINPVFRPQATIVLDPNKIYPMKLPPGYEGFEKVDFFNRMIGVADGKYIINSIEYRGDTRGDEWYAILACSGVNARGGSSATNALVP